MYNQQLNRKELWLGSLCELDQKLFFWDNYISKQLVGEITWNTFEESVYAFRLLFASPDVMGGFMLQFYT